MQALGNILWLVLAGWWLALAYVVAGIISIIFIVTIPFAIASFRLASYALWPFGRAVVFRDSGAGMSALAVIGNVLWLFLGGLALAVGHLVAGVLLCLTIIGIPLGLASFKMVRLALLPFGSEIVSTEEAHRREDLRVAVRA